MSDERLILSITSGGRRYFVKAEGDPTPRGLRALREHLSTLERDLAAEADAPYLHNIADLASRLIFDPIAGAQVDDVALEAAERGFRRFAFNGRIYDVDCWKTQWDENHRPTDEAAR
jgi:hypothetical protein